MRSLTSVLLALSLSACSSLYYAGMEKVGVPKRDLLSRRVERARDAQEDVKKEFSSALDRFRAVVRVDGGELEQQYDALRDELRESEERTEQLATKIDDVESVAEALFEEWEDELDDYKRGDLRAASERRLQETKQSYRPMIKAMRRAQQRVEPVLEAFRDVVLALKHQLNANAVQGIEGELSGVEREVDSLINETNRSIREATKFLGALDDHRPAASDS